MLARAARHRPLGGCVALVVLAHGLGLSALWQARGSAELPLPHLVDNGRAPAFEVRQVVPRAEPTATAHEPAQAAAAARPRVRATPGTAAAAVITRMFAGAGELPAAPGESAASDDASPGAPAHSAEPIPPVYRSSPPPSQGMVFDVQRGTAVGTASLRWQLGDHGRYVLELQGAGNDAPSPEGAHPGAAPSRGAAAAFIRHWRSEGALDAAGLAPERFAVWRRGRERHAANFRRDVGIVSFAGPAQTWPLLAGAQDRLSWMVQLAAVLQAEPSRAAPGSEISMMVVGAHGDAGRWTFTALGETTLDPRNGGEPWRALRFRRESHHAHDPHVEVWLAPALHHLPVRLVLTLPAGGESTEWRLRTLQPQ